MGNVLRFKSSFILKPIYSAFYILAALTLSFTFLHSPKASAVSNTPIFFSDGQNIYSVSPDGTGTTSYGSGVLPHLSPDGTKILYEAFGFNVPVCAGDDAEYEIFTKNIDGSNASELTNNDGLCEISNPVWSPDGSKIAFDAFPDQHGSNYGEVYVYTMNADGSDLQQLQPGTNPTWSPDGSKIAYVSNQGDGGIEIMNADGTNTEQIVASGDNPSWSPDGSKIAFQNWDNNQLQVVNTDGSDLTTVYSAVSGGGFGEYDSVAWSPDGSSLAFSYYIPITENSYGLYTIPISGGNATQVVPGKSSSSGPQGAEVLSWANAPETQQPIQAISAGGPASGNYVADTDYTGGNTYSTSSSVDTSNVQNPAPQSVYQNSRYGKAFSYTFSGLTPNATYTLRLDFNELYWGTAQSSTGGMGSRVFNVSVNGQSALSNFDIYAAAGGSNKAITEQVPTTADSSGNVTITFAAVTDNALVNGLALYSGTLPPLATPPPATSAYIAAGSSNAIGNFSSDNDYSGGTTYTSSASVDTSEVTNPAPEDVYLNDRYGTNFTYTVPNLTPNTNYNVRLDFNEPYWGVNNNGGAGSRLFNVVINGTQVLSNFDVYATAGGANKAVAENFSTTSDPNGRITINFAAVTDNAMVSGVEVTQP